jgi:hypothetical protein
MGMSLVLAVAPVWGHHSFAAEFDQNKVVRLQGTVTEMEWVNPHAVIHLAVKSPDGTVVNWAIEGNTPNSLLRAGLTKKSLAPGTEILVQGYLSRSGENKASGSSILMKDGKQMSLGSSADGSPAGKSVLTWISSDEELWKRQLEALAANTPDSHK